MYLVAEVCDKEIISTCSYKKMVLYSMLYKASATVMKSIIN